MKHSADSTSLDGLITFYGDWTEEEKGPVVSVVEEWRVVRRDNPLIDLEDGWRVQKLVWHGGNVSYQAQRDSWLAGWLEAHTAQELAHEIRHNLGLC